ATTSKHTPVIVARATYGTPALASVALYGNHTCALDTSGDAWCWGEYTDGRLGGNIYADRSSPAPVHMPPGVTFVTIDSGSTSSCALDTSGQVWCWGSNSMGQIGDGTQTDRYAPNDVVEP
ncbi:RCC1 repeat-containing protein, partial [Myxococcota bacterium]|nr:RCC1 repeat-containing protein [Myxococcota bacterium]